MTRKPILLILFTVICLILSCKKNSVPPPPKPEETSIDKTLLTGWWSPVEKGKAKLYFGKDSFFYKDTTLVYNPYKVTEPIPGFWRLNGKNIEYSAVQNSSATIIYDVIELTNNSLVVKTSGVTSSYIKVDLPAITTPSISTIAGNGTAGYSGDGGPAARSTVGNLRGLITDKAGNLYFCDDGNNVVRKISAADGKISTIAGTGKKDFNPKTYVDNSLATSIDLYSPAGLAIDAAGNIYVSEAMTRRGRVDKITSDGKIFHVAGDINKVDNNIGDGGPAVDAIISEPVGLAIDASGNLYIADIQNNRIRKVSAKNKTISTVAGNGKKDYLSPADNVPATATEVQPIYLAVDADNNIYFTDLVRQGIRKVTASTGMISIFASNKKYLPQDSGDGGLIYDATVGWPWGLCIASNGDIYFIGDFMSVRKVDHKTNIVTKIAGNGYKGYIGDGLHATAYSLESGNQVAVFKQHLAFHLQ
jgi:sugar lactone lactonase YvrE